MLFRLILLFTIVPLGELSLLIKLGQQIGLLNTLAIVILTGFAGAYLARSEGFSVLHRIQTDMQGGKLPGDSLIDGALILAGALLLLTPGLVTDVVGFAVLLPLTRAPIKRYLKNYFSKKLNQGEIHVNYKVER